MFMRRFVIKAESEGIQTESKPYPQGTFSEQPARGLSACLYRRLCAWRRAQGDVVPHDRAGHMAIERDGVAADECASDGAATGKGGQNRDTDRNHSFRATGITAYLKNGGTLAKAAAMANHASTHTTQLYDRAAGRNYLERGRTRFDLTLFIFGLVHRQSRMLGRVRWVHVTPPIVFSVIALWFRPRLNMMCHALYPFVDRPLMWECR